MSELSAKVAKARQAGYSDDEITAFLGKDPSLAPKINQARQAGYKPADIVKHLEAAPKSKALADARRLMDVGKDIPVVGDWNESLMARARGASFGFLDEAQGGLNALRTGAQNALAPITGKPAGYSMKEAYDAGRQVSNEQDKNYAARKPVSNAINQLAGGAWAPGAKYVGGAKTMGQAALRTAQVGAAYGGVAGAGNAEPGQRVIKAIEGAGIGAAIGGATPYIARGAQWGAKRLGSAAVEAGNRVRLGFGGADSEPTARQIAQAGDKATEYVGNIARRAQPGSLSGNAVEAAGKPITAAEALGRPAMTQLAAVSRREGKTGDALESVLRQRQQAMPERVLADLEEVTGLTPEFIYGDHAANAASLRVKARPLYDAGYQEPIPDDPRLVELMSRPAVKKAFRNAGLLAKEEGRNPEELALTSMDTFKGFLTGRAPSAAVDAKDIAALRSGKAGESQGQGLIEFMAKNGGLKDFGGELRARDLDIWHKKKPFMNKLLRPDGLGEEAMAQKAFEAGYFPEKVAGRMDGADNMQTVTAQELRDAVSAELAGKTRFAREMKDPAQRARLDDLERRLLEEGADPRTISVDDAGRVLGRRDDELARLEAFAYGDAPGMSPNEPVATTKPTMQTMDYIKRGLDDVLEGYRDKTTGKLVLDERGRAVLQTLNEFRSIIAPKGSAMRAAMDAGGDPIRLEQAFNNVKRQMSNGVPFRLFMDKFQKLGDGERQAYVAGWVNDAFEGAQSGRLKLRDMQSPLYADKVKAMLGPERAKAVLDKLALEVEIARRGSRMMPGGGSPTMELQAADKEVAEGLKTVRGVGKKIANGQPIAAALEAIASPIAGAYRGAQAPIDQATRDEVGRLLQLSPSELDAVLKAARVNTPKPLRMTKTAIGAGALARSSASGNAKQ